jgi:ribulose-phosphate 3-epimerase
MIERHTIRLAPSILSADAGALWAHVEEAIAAGVDAIHVDVMDGRFVPNIAFGPEVVKALRRRSNVALDVHMMVREPGHLVPVFAEAGATSITVHAEACTHLHRVVAQVKESGAQVGVALSPATPVNAVEEVIAELDLVLVMTVDPGYASQAFIPSVLPKVSRVRAILDERGLGAMVGVDGGITAETAPEAVAAGARSLVAGSAIFNPRESVADAVARLRGSVGEASS